MAVPTGGDPGSVRAQSGDVGGFLFLLGFSVGRGRGRPGTKGLGEVVRKKGRGEFQVPEEAWPLTGPPESQEVPLREARKFGGGWPFQASQEGLEFPLSAIHPLFALRIVHSRLL